jgi:hypothetical protein
MRKPLSLLLLLAGLIAPGSALAYEDNHPRLLFDPAMLAWLPDSIAADPVKSYTWDRMEAMGQLYQDLHPVNVLSSNYGTTSFPTLGFVAHLAADDLADSVEAKLLQTTLYLAENHDVYGDGDDLTAALRLRTLLLGYDLAFAAATPEEHQAVAEEIQAYLEVMTTDPIFTRGIYNPFCGNHSICIGAVLILAELCLRDDWQDDPLLTAARNLGERLVAKGLFEQQGMDGSFSEGGLYLAWAFRLLIPTWEAIDRLDGYAPWDLGKLAATLDWAAYQLLPRGAGYFLNRNDCSETSRPLSRHDTLWNWSQHRLSDPRFARWVQNHITGADGYSNGDASDYSSVILFRHDGELLHPEDRLAPSRFFPDQGLYVYRAGWPGGPLAASYHFTIQAGSFPGGHWQEDVGQFTLRAFGHTLAMDHGPGPLAKETEAHNLPLIDGIGQHNAGAGIGTDGALSLISGEGFLHVLLADIEPAYNGHSPYNDPDFPLPGTDWSWGYDGGNPLERAQRWVLLFPGVEGKMPTLYLCDDFRKDNLSHNYQSRLHFGEAFSLSVSSDRYHFDGTEGDFALRQLAPAPESTSWSTAPFDNGESDSNSTVLMVTRQAVDGRFCWEFLPLADGAEGPVSVVTRYPGGVRLQSGEATGRQRHLLAAWGNSLLADGWMLEGRFGVVETEVNSQRSALVEGSSLRSPLRLFAEVDPPCTVVADTDTIWMSRADATFEIYAPLATAVVSAGEPVPFIRMGDYLFSLDATSTPEAELATDGWRLTTRRGKPLRLVLEGPGAQSARVRIYDLNGRRRLTLHEGALAPGRTELPWSGRDRSGRRLASGLYFARLDADDQSCSTRMLLLRPISPR